MSATVSPSTALGLDATTLARLKTSLLSEGLRVTPAGREALGTLAKPILRVRSGSCGGLDLVLPDGSYVNCPVNEPFAAHSSLVLDGDDAGRLAIRDTSGRFDETTATAVPAPAYYGVVAASGTPLHRIGQLCSDRLGIGMTNICTYYRSKSSRCKFCSIGANVVTENGRKQIEEIVEAASAAYSDPVAPARHLLFGGGTPDGPDAGAIAMAEAARAIKERWSQPIYAMLAPPEDLGYLELLRDSGVDEIGMNVELFSDDAAARYMPGKHRATPLERYLVALERAVELFGRVNTRSITVVGLEAADTTVAGVELLASRGVMPILSPFRPLVGTLMEDHPRLPADELWDLTLRAADAAARYDMPLGPTCIPCQSNTLTLPGRSEYRFY